MNTFNTRISAEIVPHLAALKAGGWSYSAIAKRLDVSRGRVSEWAAGRGTPWSINVVDALMEIRPNDERPAGTRRR